LENEHNKALGATGIRNQREVRREKGEPKPLRFEDAA
jgi:hypothetical protein